MQSYSPHYCESFKYIALKKQYCFVQNSMENSTFPKHDLITIVQESKSWKMGRPRAFDPDIVIQSDSMNHFNMQTWASV